MSYATKCDPHAMGFAEQLMRGLSEETKRALLTLMIGDGVMPTLDPLASCTAVHAERTRAVWDTLVKLQPGRLPLAAEAAPAAPHPLGPEWVMQQQRAAGFGQPTAAGWFSEADGRRPATGEQPAS